MRISLLRHPWHSSDIMLLKIWSCVLTHYSLNTLYNFWNYRDSLTAPMCRTNLNFRLVIFNSKNPFLSLSPSHLNTEKLSLKLAQSKWITTKLACLHLNTHSVTQCRFHPDSPIVDWLWAWAATAATAAVLWPCLMISSAGVQCGLGPGSGVYVNVNPVA